MEPHEVIITLEASDEFKEWLTQHKDHFLAHIFLQEGNEQVGFYNPRTEKMTTFIVADKISSIADQEVLKGDTELQALELSQVQITLHDALEKAQEVLEEEYSKEIILRNLVVLQQLDDIATYNITYFSQSFKTINVRIRADTGEILSHSAASLADFVK
ncbi:hypothetical protein GF342_00770 [Candidatus Woesearchaeota archaeon]|nr:hypothetical protein [Candidatus Woesearchaeota archaeon]